MIEITLSTVMGQMRLGLRGGVFGARILPMAVVTTMNGAKAGHGRMTCRRADSHSAGFGFVSNPCHICWISRTTSGDTSCRIHTKCFKQHVLLKMHHVPFRFTAATETVEEDEMGMSRVRVVSLIPFTSYQVRTS